MNNAFSASWAVKQNSCVYIKTTKQKKQEEHKNNQTEALTPTVFGHPDMTTAHFYNDTAPKILACCCQEPRTLSYRPAKQTNKILSAPLIEINIKKYNIVTNK